MSDRRFFRWATTSARLLAGTLVAVGFVIAVVTAVSVPWPHIEGEPVRVEATPAPAETVLVCDGALLALGRDAEQAAMLSVAAAGSVTVGVMDGSTEPVETQLDSPDVVDGEGVPVYTAVPEARTRTDIAASSSASASDDDLSGLAASSCRPPLLESWLVGGSGTIGAADLILLSNPGDVAATVQLTVYGASGASTPPGSALVVAPGTQRVIPLAGLALGEQSPVVRVTATGAPVQAALQTSLTRTLLPGGVDQVAAIAAPDPSVVITGVTAGAAPADAATGEPMTILRLLSPSLDTTATVTVTRVGSTEPLREETVALTSAGPAELDLGRLVGAYTVFVEAEAPVLAGVWQATGFGARSDFAWYTPSVEIARPTMFATPAGPPPRLTLVNTSDADATVAVTSADGLFETEVEVPSGESVEVRLPARGVFRLEPGGASIRAAISISGARALAGFPVWPADAAAQPITVYP